MKFTVVWRPSAEAKLAEIWASADDRQSVTNAADSIDSLLRDSPLEVGESRKENSRFLSVAPLSIYFDVLEEDCQVQVWAVWNVRRR